MGGDEINDRQLRYFARVVEVGNMTRAASLLNVAQPALGLQIRQLEESLGTPLFERHSRGVSVTPAGRLLYGRAKEILHLIEDAEREVKASGKARRETVRLGLTPSIMRLVGSDILIAARRDLPDVLLSLIEEPSFVLEAALERGEIDLALTYEIAQSPGVTCREMMIEELQLIGRPNRLPPCRPVTLADVLGMELVLAHDRDMIRRLVEAAAQGTGQSVNVVYEVQSLQATRKVVLDGLALSILPYGTVADELASGALAARRIVEPRLRRRLFIARSTQVGRFRNEAGITKLLRAIAMQLTIDLGPLAEPVSEPEPV